MMLLYKIDRSATLNQQNKWFKQHCENYFGCYILLCITDISRPELTQVAVCLLCEEKKFSTL